MGDVFIASLGPWAPSTDADGNCEKCGQHVRYFSAQRPAGVKLLCTGCAPSLDAFDVEGGVREHKRRCTEDCCPCQYVTTADMVAIIKAKLPALRRQ